jgi:hypothetical protein
MVLLTAAVAVSAFALGPAPASTPVPHPAASAADPFGQFGAAEFALASSGCGVERWAVKTGSDADRYAVSTSQHPTTIAALRGLTKPSSYPSNSRIRPAEVTEYVVAGTLTKYVMEGDGDIHLVLSDSAGRTIIAEIPSTSCVAAARFKTEIGNVRRAFLARYTPTSTFRSTQRAIRVRGIGFFDYRHGQTGVAPNGIELHPVLGLAFP